jgi:hypothetical protein
MCNQKQFTKKAGRIQEKHLCTKRPLRADGLRADKKTDAPKGTSVDILGPRKRPAYVGRGKKKAAGIFLSPLAKP